ncbi:peptidyl-alpha-hydroxyglycine alpha-amidating lyase family protein [Neolewinella sp.]|uniref:peptidyl-alpha-hydroxyglycine alpha-amidating lyase family protein n=1 Tax=Neolewinella sp. TaxID=2993543 RepID=UPI003B51783A
MNYLYGILALTLLGCAARSVTDTDAPAAVLPLAYQLTDWPAPAAAARMGQPVGVGILGDGTVAVFHRGLSDPAPYVADDAVQFIHPDSGEPLASWGGGFFIRPHGMHVDADEHIWLTDIARHQVFKFTRDGRLLLTLGEEGIAGADSAHFDQPTDVAVGPRGNIFVTDGYGNRRVVKFAPDGRYLTQWGREGSAAGEFINPHAIDISAEGQLYVSDRENNRVQVFDTYGTFKKAYALPAATYAAVHDASTDLLYVTDYRVIGDTVVIGSDVYTLNERARAATSLVGRAGPQVQRKGSKPCRYHDLAIDTGGNLYLPDLTNRIVVKYVD